MHPLSVRVLEMLWKRADGADLKQGARTPSVTFSPSSLPEYHQLASAADRDAVHAELRSVESLGAIAIDYDRRARALQINRVRLADFAALGRAIGRKSSCARLEEARSVLEPYKDFPGVADLLRGWEQGRAPRRLSIDKLWEVSDACKLVASRLGSEHIPSSLRRASAKVLGDSKRAERICGAIDVVLNGVSSDPLDDVLIFEQIGLLRYPQTLLISGQVELVLASGQITPCHQPYAGFPPSSLSGIVGKPRFVLSVENLTTFHELAAGNAGPNRGVLLYTAGFPSRAWREAYLRVVLTARAPVYHWGDTDASGFEIAASLAEVCSRAGTSLSLWKMGEYERGEANKTLKQGEISRIRAIAETHGWMDQIRGLEPYEVGIEQEVQDLAWPD